MLDTNKPNLLASPKSSSMKLSKDEFNASLNN